MKTLSDKELRDWFNRIRAGYLEILTLKRSVDKEHRAYRKYLLEHHEVNDNDGDS